MKKILIIVALITVLIVGYILSSKFRNNPATDCPEPTCLAPVATTTPVVETGATTTKNFYDKNLGVGFSYPDNFYINENLTDYISPVEWPPQITVDSGKYVCKTSGNKILPDGKTETKNINGNVYCLTTQAEGAAGSTYTTYTYKRPVTGKNVSLTFITRVPQCANYDEPKQTDCKNEIQNFFIDNMIDKVFQTVKFAVATSTATTTPK